MYVRAAAHFIAGVAVAPVRTARRVLLLTHASSRLFSEEPRRQNAGWRGASFVYGQQCRSLYGAGMRQSTIPALLTATTGTTPHTTTLANPVCAKRFHRQNYSEQLAI